MIVWYKVSVYISLPNILYSIPLPHYEQWRKTIPQMYDIQPVQLRQFGLQICNESTEQLFLYLGTRQLKHALYGSYIASQGKVRQGDAEVTLTIYLSLPICSY